MILEPFLSFCSALWTNRVLWFIQNCCVTSNCVTSNFFNPKTIMRICCLECLTLMFCLILFWKIRCIKITRQLFCEFRHQNYSACALMIYTKWTPCNGTDCPLGLQRRFKGICCPYSGNKTVAMAKNECKKNCNLSYSDFYELAPYICSTQLPILTPSLSTRVLLSTIDGKFWHQFKSY